MRHYLGQMIESCQELGHRIDPPTEPTPAPQPTRQPEPTPAQARSQLDAAIADLAEQIRVELWRVAAAAWRSHHDNPDAAVARRGQADLSHGLRLAAGDRRG